LSLVGRKRNTGDFSCPHPGKNAAGAKSDVPVRIDESSTTLTTVVQKDEVE